MFHRRFLGTDTHQNNCIFCFLVLLFAVKNIYFWVPDPAAGAICNFRKIDFKNMDLWFFAKCILYVIHYMRYRRALGLLKSETDFSDLLFSLPPPLTQNKTKHYLGSQTLGTETYQNVHLKTNKSLIFGISMILRGCEGIYRQHERTLSAGGTPCGIHSLTRLLGGAVAAGGT